MTTRHRMFIRALAVLLIALVPTVARAARADRPIVSGKLGKELDAAVRRAGGDELWGSVLVAREGKILLAKGYGFADYGKVPNTPATLFELASVSKHVTAVAILRLEQEGRLKITDPVSRFFPDVPADKRGIRIEHLLSCTSGLSEEGLVPYSSTVSRKAAVARAFTPPLRFAPGEKYEYCNVGFAVLAAIVEKVAKTSFEKYVEKRLFAKAKLRDTGFIGDRDLRKTGRASARRTNEPGSWTAANWHRGWGYRGMGGVVTTVLDVHRWDRALRGDDILKDEAKKKMYTVRRSDYALGWRMAITGRGTRKAHHTGSVAGYGTNLVRYLEEDVLIVVLSNHGRPAWNVALAVEKVLFEAPRIELSLDRKGYEVDGQGVVRLPTDLRWEARKRSKSITLRLAKGKRAPVEIRATDGFGRGLLSQLDAALSAEAASAGGPELTRTVFAVGAYGSGTRVRLTDGLTLGFEPAAGARQGKVPLADRRWRLYILDAGRNYRPLFVELNREGVRSLAGALREALGA